MRAPLKVVPLEILDNASTDETAGVIAGAMHENPNITLVSHKFNIGAAGNLLRAYERFETEYCWVLCDDDVINADAANELLAVLREKPDVIIVSSFGVKNSDYGYIGSLSRYIARGGGVLFTGIIFAFINI